MENRFRILSLDGGGPWSLIQARTLGRIFSPDMAGRDLLSHFDLVISNSGGAVVIAGLLADMTPRSIETNCFADQTWARKLRRRARGGPRLLAAGDRAPRTRRGITTSSSA
jgi:uncharacterized protein